MNDDERRLIEDFVQRVSGGARPPVGWGMPAQQSTPPLPPVDHDADRLLADLFTRYPDARYRITQMAFVQEHIVAELANKVRQLEYEMEEQQRTFQAQQGQSKGLFGGLFGGSSNQPPPPAPPPQPVHAPGYQPGMFQQRPGGGGSGFAGTALAVGGGVLGGMMLGSMLGGLMGGDEASAATPEADPTAASEPATGWGEETNTDTGSGWDSGDSGSNDC